MKENLLNKKFGDLLVIEEYENIDNRVAWKCKCDCGNIKVVIAKYLKNGRVISCGCSRSTRAWKNKTPKEATAMKIWKERYNDGISFEDFYKLSQLPCNYCRAEPSNIANAYDGDLNSKYARENGTFIFNGLDRVNNSLNHTLENCVSCCRWCNLAKRERPIEDFKQWVKELYNVIKDLDIDNLNIMELNEKR